MNETTTGSAEQEKSVARETVLQAMLDLAVGRANDGVKLAFLDQPQAETIDGLDLGCLREFKRQPNGTVEVKLTDRAAVLEKLLEQLKQDPQNGAAAFLRALDGEGEQTGVSRR